MLSTQEKPKSIEEYLNGVSFKDDTHYVPSDFALEFVNFIKLVNGAEGEEHLTPVLHYKMLDRIAHTDERLIANMVFRGAAKTTLFGEYFFLYLGTYGKLPGFGTVDLALYVTDSIENGVKNMRKNMEFRWEESEFLQNWIPKIKFTDIRWEFQNRSGHTFIVKGYGAKTGVRGSKEKAKRPDLALLDDLISDDDARSPTVIASVEDTIYKAIDYALHPTRSKMIWCGTPFNASDPLYKAIESGAWAVNVFPVCEKFPCTREEFRGAWPDRFTYEAVKEKYDKAMALGRVDTFNQEMMLRIMSEDDRLILDPEIKWYSRQTLLQNQRAFNFYITTDFATSEKQSADFSVIAVWALNSSGYWFLVDGICKRQLMDQNVEDLFRLAQQYKPLGVGVEVSGQQGGFIPWLSSEMMRKNCFFNLASDNNSNRPGIKPNTNKLTRFMIVVPWFKQGLMHFPEELKDSPFVLEFMNELSLASPSGFKSKHDDCIDTISMLSVMNTFKPNNVIPLTKDSSGIWDWDIDDEESYSGLNSYVV